MDAEAEASQPMGTRAGANPFIFALRIAGKEINSDSNGAATTVSSRNQLSHRPFKMQKTAAPNSNATYRKRVFFISVQFGRVNGCKNVLQNVPCGFARAFCLGG